MTAAMKRRIDALEKDENATSLNLWVVIAEIGETAETALRREGIERSDSTVIVATFS
jgi:hypothetical protein